MNMQLNLVPWLEVINLGQIMYRFEEAVNATMKPKVDDLFGKQVFFSSSDKEFYPMEGWGPKNNFSNTVKIKAIHEATNVAAIDSSCVLIGETSEGSIYSAKCCLVLSCIGKSLIHFKVGPMLFYIDNDVSKSSIIEKRLWNFALLDPATTKRMIRIRIERIMQNQISKLFSNTIILVDGSLKRSLFEDEHNGFNTILQNCKTGGNQLVGISKTTKLKVLDKFSSSLMRRNDACYIDVSYIVKRLVSNIIGHSLLAKLSPNGLALRTDVLNDPSEVLGRLVTNDVIVNGYPETLRLAHHVSTFTTTEMTCLKGLILSKFGAKEIMCEDVRRTLLGTFL